MVCCDHKLLEPFLSKGTQIPNRWSMELGVFNITFVHIQGTFNILADTISRLKTLNIYKETLDSPIAQIVSSSQ